MSIAVRAFEIAESAHDGQFDKQGDPYILHPMRVGLMSHDEIGMAVGFLHDVLEDTEYTEDELRAELPGIVVDAVVALTRLDGETYMNFILRCSQNPIACDKKIDDIRDNSRPGYTRGDLRKRYVKALPVLLAAQAAHRLHPV